MVSDGYLAAMGVALKAGRDLTERDDADGESVVMINESLARALWPGEDAVGKVVDQDGGRRVVGVVADVRHQGLEVTSGCEMYIPMRQTNDYGEMDLVVRSTLAPGGLTAAVRQELHALDPDLPANQFETSRNSSTRQSRRDASLSGCSPALQSSPSCSRRSESTA